MKFDISLKIINTLFLRTGYFKGSRKESFAETVCSPRGCP